MKFKLTFKHRQYDYSWNQFVYEKNRQQALEVAQKIASTTNSKLTGLYQYENPSTGKMAKNALITSILIRKAFKPFYL